MSTVIIIRQIGFEKLEGDYETMHARYVEAEKEVDLDTRVLNHTVAVFLYGDNDDLVDAYSIKGTM